MLQVSTARSACKCVRYKNHTYCNYHFYQLDISMTIIAAFDDSTSTNITITNETEYKYSTC